MGWVTLTQRKMELKARQAQYSFEDLQLSRTRRQMAREKNLRTMFSQNEEERQVNIFKTEYYAQRDKLNKEKSELNEFLAAVQKAKSVKNASFTDDALVYPTDKESANSVFDANGEALRFYSYNDNGIVVYSTSTTYSSMIGEAERCESCPDEGFVMTPDDIVVRDDGSAYFALHEQDEIENPDSLQYMNSIKIPDGLAGYCNGPINDDTINAIKTQISALTMQLENEISAASEKFNTEKDSIKRFYEDEQALIEEEANEQETRMDLEQAEIETQLESISNELQAVDGAISSGIQATTIKLA